MTTFRRLLRLTAGQRRWIAIGAALGFLAVGANVALMAMSAYLISRAAIVSNVAEVALVITAVRVLAIGRAAFRYLERYVTHRATFAILADLRVWFFASIEPLAPARLATRRSGDLLARIVADIETLEDFFVRVVIPPVVAALVTVFAGLLLGAPRHLARAHARDVPPGVGGRAADRVAEAVTSPCGDLHRDARRVRRDRSSTRSTDSPTSSRSTGRPRIASEPLPSVPKSTRPATGSPSSGRPPRPWRPCSRAWPE